MKKILITLITIIILIMIGITVIRFWPKAEQQEVKIINRIDEYGYILEENETKIHQKYFEQLIDVLSSEEIDEEAYAELVVKLFISDFYNLDNKVTKNDVGGIQYIHPAAKDNMVLKAKDTIYKYIENNIDNTRTEKLPIVISVEIEGVQVIKFKYGDKIDQHAYQVTATWTYKEDLGYQNKAIIKLVHEGQKLCIAELE